MCFYMKSRIIIKNYIPLESIQDSKKMTMDLFIYECKNLNDFTEFPASFSENFDKKII